MNRSMPTPLLATLTLLAGVAIGLGTPADAVPALAAKALTASRVTAIAQREANQVLDTRSSTLHVAAAKTAETAQTAQSAQTAQTAQSAETAHTAQSAETADHADDADRLGGKAPGAYVKGSDIGRASGINQSCNPTGTAYSLCSNLYVSTAAPLSTVLMVWQAPVGADSSAGARGTCRLVLDNDVIWEVVVAGSGTGFTTMRDVGPGGHLLQQQCNETAGDLRLASTSVSALAVPTGS